MTGEVHVEAAEATEWLMGQRGNGPVVAVLPDAAEVGLTVEEWHPLFMLWANACMGAAAKHPTVFLQTDRKVDGRLVSKAYMLMLAAAKAEVPLRWHKIVTRRAQGSVDLYRPAYSHMLAFGGPGPGRAFPDVIEAGKYLWPNGIGQDAAARIIAWLAEVDSEGPIVNPFCGMGTLLLAAAATGRDGQGCDLDEDRIAKARALSSQMALGLEVVNERGT